MSRRSWTKEEKDYVKKNYRTTKNKDMAEKLGRTRMSIKRWIASNLEPRTEEEVKLLITFKKEEHWNWKGGQTNEELNETRRKYYKEVRMGRDKHKTDAQRKAKRALKKGEIKRDNCFMCGEEQAVMHHTDYSKPLDVTWLCTKHHIWVHKMIRLCQS